MKKIFLYALLGYAVAIVVPPQSILGMFKKSS